MDSHGFSATRQNFSISYRQIPHNLYLVIPFSSDQLILIIWICGSRILVKKGDHCAWLLFYDIRLRQNTGERYLDINAIESIEETAIEIQSISTTVIEYLKMKKIMRIFLGQ
jgi:hypothetical protein